VQAPDQVREVLRRIEFPAPDRVLVDGREVEILPLSDTGGSGDSDSVPGEADALARVLYRVWYTGQPDGDGEGDGGAAGPGAPDLVEALAAANASEERWDAGWASERAAGGGQVVAVKGGRRRTLGPGTYVRADGRSGRLASGVPLRVLHAREAHPSESGFYFAHGAGGPEDERRMVRFYLNVDERSAVDAMARLTARLVRFGVPFSFKVADRRALLRRIDSSVLYAERRHFRLVAELVAETLAELTWPLLPATPPLTKPLAEGVGFAEDPGFGQSFGVDRCMLVADALWEAARAGETAEDEMLEAVSRGFTRRGLSLDTPWLALAGPDDYRLPDV
jgi:hypothetical protein